MLRSLKFRLIASHFLPILVLVPLLSLLLIYLLETRFALNDIATELEVQGRLVARLTQYDWQAWTDPDRARPLMARLQVQLPARVYLLDRNGNLMVASGVVTATTKVPISSPNPDLIQQALRGEMARQIRYGLDAQSSSVDVAVPVVNEDQEVVGVVQLTQQLGTLGAQLSILRWSVFGTFAAGMLLAGLLSFILTRSVNRPLEHLTAATRNVRFDVRPDPVPVTGPSEIRTLAHTFNGMADRLYELEQGRRRLLRSIVHELGRPLGAIKAAAQVLGREGQDPALVDEMASGIDEQVDQLRRLLDDLALLAQSDVRDLELAVQPLDIGDLVQRECRRNEAKMADRSISLDCRVGEELPPIEADPVRIAQILGNLLDNAYKYTPGGGSVTVSTRGDGDAVVVRVADTGPGVASAEREQIFRFFYRAPDQNRVYEGMGIGLALSRRLAEAHGGSLTLAEADGGGACFELRLPRP